MGYEALNTMMDTIRHRSAPSMGDRDLPEAVPASLVNRVSRWVFRGIINRFRALQPGNDVGEALRGWCNHFGADPDWRPRRGRKRQKTFSLTEDERTAIPGEADVPVRVHLNLKSYRPEGVAQYREQTDTVVFYLRRLTPEQSITSDGEPCFKDRARMLGVFATHFLRLPSLVAHELTHCFEQRPGDEGLTGRWPGDDELYPYLNEMAARISTFTRLRGTITPNLFDIVTGRAESRRGFGRTIPGRFWVTPFDELCGLDDTKKDYLTARLSTWARTGGLVEEAA